MVHCTWLLLDGRRGDLERVFLRAAKRHSKEHGSAEDGDRRDCGACDPEPTLAVVRFERGRAEQRRAERAACASAYGEQIIDGL